MGVAGCLKITKLILLDICLNLTNLVLTFINIHLFYETENSKYGNISLFLLWFPGIVTAAGFLYLYFTGSKATEQLDTKKVVAYPLILLLFYPILPVLLTVVYLIKKDDVHYERARLARLFASFLDHAPQFVIRVVVVVLMGIPHRGLYTRNDTAFILSMVASILSLVLSAIVFNESRVFVAVRLFLSVPMFAAIFSARAFTLAVFMREALKDNTWGLHEASGFGVLIVMAAINLGLYRWCGQDWPRSIVFSLTSLLVPSGYANDPFYYQLPNQNLLKPQTKYAKAPRLRKQGSRDEIEIQLQQQNDQVSANGDGEDITHLVPMKSGRYLLSHIIINTVVLLIFSIYFYMNTKREVNADDVLVLPQILCVVPGLFFGVGRSFLHDDILPIYEDNTTTTQKCDGGLRKGIKITFAVIFTIIGYAAIGGEIVNAIIYKLFQFAKDN